jgi:HEAT repeat protein
MADRLAAIRKLLTHERQERRCAAAIVLAELGAGDSRTVSALAEALEDEDAQVRRLALEALGQAESDDAVEPIIARLDDPDPLVQRAAEATLLQLGDMAVPALQHHMQDEGSSSIRRKVAGVLSRLQTPAGIESLIDLVDGQDQTLLDRARQALRAKSSSLTPPEIRALRKKLDTRLGEASISSRGSNGLSAALLQLLGDLPDETVVTRLTKEIGPETPIPVRRAAMAGLMSALPQARGRRKEAAAERLLDCLAENDEEGVIRPALRALKDVEIPGRLTSKLQALVSAPTSAARAFALGALGRIGAPDSISTLIEQLVLGSAPVRAAARDALATAPDAAPALVRAVFEVKDPARLLDIAELLSMRRESLRPEDRMALCIAALERIESGQEDASLIADTVARALPDEFIAVVRERVAEARQNRQIVEAFALLEAIKSSPPFSQEEQYQLAVFSLIRNPEATSRPPRVADRVCVPFSELLRLGFPIEARLRKETLVRVQDIFYLGFAFAESNIEEERDFGADLLEEVAQREPDGKFGARALNKLKLMQRV